MSAHKFKFVLVNDMAPRKPSVCTECYRLTRVFDTLWAVHRRARTKSRKQPHAK
jgi:hypothetical protein